MLPRKEGIAIIDIDGTLANLEHRLHHIKSPNRDWEAFYDACVHDEPIDANLEVLKMFIHHRPMGKIYFFTGREATVREQTQDWLIRFIPSLVFYRWDLWMRPRGQWTKDTELKGKMYQLLCNTENDGKPFQPFLILEDRSAVVQMYRELGLTCWQVAEGDY